MVSQSNHYEQPVPTYHLFKRRIFAASGLTSVGYTKTDTNDSNGTLPFFGKVANVHGIIFLQESLSTIFVGIIKLFFSAFGSLICSMTVLAASYPN